MWCVCSVLSLNTVYALETTRHFTILFLHRLYILHVYFISLQLILFSALINNTNFYKNPYVLPYKEVKTMRSNGHRVHAELSTQYPNTHHRTFIYKSTQSNVYALLCTHTIHIQRATYLCTYSTIPSYLPSDVYSSKYIHYERIYIHLNRVNIQVMLNIFT